MKNEALTIKLSILAVLVLLSSQVKSQIKPVTQDQYCIGSLCPDFSLNDVHYFTKRKITLSDFKGKWLIIDYWSAFCGSCVNAMPRADSLQKEFKDKLQYLLIGYTGSIFNPSAGSEKKQITQLYNKVRQKENLHLTIAYDSVQFKKYNIIGCPVIIVVDPRGIVRRITCSIDRQDILMLIAGKTPTAKKCKGLPGCQILQ